jgi:hypothetical protein
MNGFLQTAVIHIRMDFANEKRPTFQGEIIDMMRNAAMNILSDFFHNQITIEVLTDKEYNEQINNGQ